MKITGYMLRESIKQHELRRDTAARAFPGTLNKFPNEEKETPHQAVKTFLEAEDAIVRLQVAQSLYNLAVKVEANGEKMTLEEAIKRIGGYARAEKMWRSAAGPKNDRYSSYGNNDRERDHTKVFAKETVTSTEAVKFATAAAKKAGALRAAIATGNASSVEMEDLDPTLFE